MTAEEKQEIISSVLSAIRTNSALITDLTEITRFPETGYFEISGGRRISSKNLKECIQQDILRDVLLPFLNLEPGEGVEFGMTAEEREMLEKLANRFEVDETNIRLLVHGDETDDGHGGVTNREYFVELTELVAPNTPTVATTTYYAVTGNVSVAVTNQTDGATMKWRASSDGGTTWTQWTTTTGSVSLASGFSDSADNTDKEYVLQVKAIKNLVESTVGEHTITIKPKVASGSINITRSPHDNNWATSASIVLTPSASKDAISEYTPDSGTTWIALNQTTTLTTSSSITAEQYQVRATKSNYAAAEVEKCSAYTLNAKKAYYGFSTASALTTEANIQALASTGGYKEATKLSGALTITPTGNTSGYVWLCCTAALNKDSIVPNQGDVIPFGFESAITVGSYKCYRSTNAINPESTNVYIP